jgi:hypothetical protein
LEASELFSVVLTVFPQHSLSFGINRHFPCVHTIKTTHTINQTGILDKDDTTEKLRLTRIRVVLKTTLNKLHKIEYIRT